MFFCRQLHVLLLMVAAAVAVSSVGIGAVRMHLLWLSIICFDRALHAAVTDLDGVSVEDFSELMIFEKVLVY